MKLLLSSFLTMLALIGIGIWLNTHILANLVGLASITGLLILYFRQDNSQVVSEADLVADKLVSNEDTEQARMARRNWYTLFAIGLLFSLLFGSFWNASMGGL